MVVEGLNQIPNCSAMSHAGRTRSSKEVISVTREELVGALEERGLTVTSLHDGRLRVVKPGAGLLAEEIGFTDGRPYWSWGARIDGDGPGEVADRINTVVSVPPGIVRNSA